MNRFFTIGLLLARPACVVLSAAVVAMVGGVGVAHAQQASAPCTTPNFAVAAQQSVQETAAEVAEAVQTPAPPIDELSCLNELNDIAGNVDISWSGLSSAVRRGLDRARNFACDAADQAVRETNRALQASAQLPYGLGTIGVDGRVTPGSNGGLTTTTSGALGDAIDDYNDILEEGGYNPYNPRGNGGGE